MRTKHGCRSGSMKNQVVAIHHPRGGQCLTHVPIHVRELFLFMLVASEASVLSNNSDQRPLKRGDVMYPVMAMWKFVRFFADISDGLQVCINFSGGVSELDRIREAWFSLSEALGRETTSRSFGSRARRSFTRLSLSSRSTSQEPLAMRSCLITVRTSVEPRD